MKNKMVYLETENKKYPLCFNLNVMEEIQEQYGSMSKWGEIVENKGEEPKIKDLKNGLMAMINEGIDIENETAESKKEFLSSKQVGRIVGDIGIKEILKKIKDLTISSTKSDNEPKNE